MFGDLSRALAGMIGCPIDCSGGCPSCSYAKKGAKPNEEEHTWKCHQQWEKWWKAHPEARSNNYKGKTADCVCEAQGC